MKITIEKASPADAEALIEYLKQAGGETDNLTFGAEGLPVSAEEEAGFLERVQTSGDDLFLVAKEDGDIVGTASLNRLPRRMRHRGEFSVSVLKEYWNRGIGSRLLERVLEFARAQDFAVIELQVRSDNAAAIHLYEKFGFQKFGTHPAFFVVEGQKIPFDFMCLRL